MPQTHTSDLVVLLPYFLSQRIPDVVTGVGVDILFPLSFRERKWAGVPVRGFWSARLWLLMTERFSKRAIPANITHLLTMPPDVHSCQWAGGIGPCSKFRRT